MSVSSNAPHCALCEVRCCAATGSPAGQLVHFQARRPATTRTKMSLSPQIRSRLTLPAVAAPMFLCSGVELAVAACKAGIVGSLTRNHCRDTEEFKSQLAAADEALNRFADQHPERQVGPLAVNISTNFADEEMRTQLALCKRYGASIVITSVGNPTLMVPMVHDA